MQGFRNDLLYTTMTHLADSGFTKWARLLLKTLLVSDELKSGQDQVTVKLQVPHLTYILHTISVVPA